MTRSEAVLEMKQLSASLHSDLREAQTYREANDTPYARRGLIRTYFALVEGLAFCMRRITLATLADTDVLTADEVVLLMEKRLELEKNGEIKKRRAPLTFQSGLLFSICCYAKNHGATFRPNTADTGWQAMQEAAEVRNRITHPRSASEFQPTEDELRRFIEAAKWWRKTMLDLFTACDEAEEYWRSQLGAPSEADGAEITSEQGIHASTPKRFTPGSPL